MSSRKNLRKLDLLAKKVLKILGARDRKMRDAALDVILLSHRDITTLKRRFIKKKGEPNVLSFPEPAHFPHPETKKRYLGEVYLNKDILQRNPERAAPLLVHGILHLLGHDHKKKSAAAKMERLERRILAALR